MPARRREVELSVERPLGPDGAGSVRLASRLEVDGERSPDPSELARELDRLKADLDALVGPALAAAPIARPDRSFSELVDTYRPRQRELVDLLRDEGELTAGEHARLVEYLAAERTARPEPSAPARVSETDRLIATVPIDRPVAPAPSRGGPGTGSERVRPVAELLATYQITTLRQAGAVRGRRQISFAEYMALKQHFEGPGGGAAESSGGADR